MKILFFIDDLRLGGRQRRFVELLRGLKEKNIIQHELALMSEEVYYTEVYKFQPQIHFLIRRSTKDPRIYYKLYRLCQELQPDIIHTWESMTSIYAFPVAKILGIKFINGMITNASSAAKIFSKPWIRTRLTFPFSDIVLSNSYAGLQSYHAPPCKSYCIHNGFDFSRIKNLESRESIRKRFNINTPKVVGMAASFSDRKDYETYIRAALLVLQKRNDVTFLAIGDGSTLPECKRLVNGKCQDRIRFPGIQENIESIINIFDIGVLTTNQKVHEEGVSNSIMEYMALGKPVVATDSGGTGEIVMDKVTGFLIQHGQVEELAERLDLLLNNSDSAERMGIAGKEKVKREFSLDIMTEKFIQIYEKCME